MKDFYYILGLDPNCSLDQAKEAYRKLSKKLHPDLNQGDEFFESRFRDIKEAFETLRDPLKRRLYDENINKFKAGRPAAAPQGQRTSAQSYAHAAYRPYTKQASAQPGKVRKRGPGIGLSITLIVLAIIVGIYLFRWYNSPAPKPQVAYTETAVTPPVVHKKHRHKHETKNIIAAENDKKTYDTAKKVAIEPTVMTPMALRPVPVKPPQTVQPETLRSMIAKTWPDSDRTHSDYLYTTYVHPNVTGVVPLRDHDRFNANIIAAIPANSRVFVLERGNIYYRVFYDNNIGFVPKWSLHQK
jgi:hypothetical protein